MLAIAGLVAGPTFADIGTVTMDIKVSDDAGATWNDSLSYANAAAVPSSLLVQITAGASASGVHGSNNGVQGLFFDLVGDALGTVTQSSLALQNAFKKAWNPSLPLTGNMGFDQFTSGGTFDTINGGLVGIGGAQAAPPQDVRLQPNPNWPYGGAYVVTRVDMIGALTPNAEGPKGLPFASVIAAGTLALATAADGVNVSISTDTGATFWQMDGNAQTGLIVNDTVLIEVLPEPATLLMLAPGLLLAMRRRRA
jgi:hypothetical protein